MTEDQVTEEQEEEEIIPILYDPDIHKGIYDFKQYSRFTILGQGRDKSDDYMIIQFFNEGEDEPDPDKLYKLTQKAVGLFTLNMFRDYVIKNLENQIMSLELKKLESELRQNLAKL